MEDENICILCGSPYGLTFHHLIPKTCHSNKWFKKNFTRTEMKENGINICGKCHSFIHRQFPVKTLGKELNTLEKIKNKAVISKYIKWAKKNH